MAKNKNKTPKTRDWLALHAINRNRRQGGIMDKQSRGNRRKEANRRACRGKANNESR